MGVGIQQSIRRKYTIKGSVKMKDEDKIFFNNVEQKDSSDIEAEVWFSP